MFVKTNTVKAIIDYYNQALDGIYSASEINVLLEIVFEYFVGYNKLDLKTKLGESSWGALFPVCVISFKRTYKFYKKTYKNIIIKKL